MKSARDAQLYLKDITKLRRRKMTPELLEVIHSRYLGASEAMNWVWNALVRLEGEINGE